MKWFSCLRYCSPKKKLRKESGRRRDKKKRRRIPTQQAGLEKKKKRLTNCWFDLFWSASAGNNLIKFHLQFLFAYTILSWLLFNFPCFILITSLASVTFNKNKFCHKLKREKSLVGFFFSFLDFFIGWNTSLFLQ